MIHDRELPLDFSHTVYGCAGPILDVVARASAHIRGLAVVVCHDTRPALLQPCPMATVASGVVFVRLLEFWPAQLIEQTAAQSLGEHFGEIAVIGPHTVQQGLHLRISNELEVTDE